MLLRFSELTSQYPEPQLLIATSAGHQGTLRRAIPIRLPPSPKMASPASDAATPVQSTPAASHVIIPAPIATTDQHVCWICLQNDTDTPNATWVNACPCSLEAHEDCLLQWIAEMETSRTRSKGGFKCPACKAPIQIEEPFDRFLAIRDHLYRQYSAASPIILSLVFTGGAAAGMASYGYVVASVFAGRDRVGRWLGLQSQGHMRWTAVPMAVLKLSSIGPGLVISHWAPFLRSVVGLPISLLVSNLPTRLLGTYSLLTPSVQYAASLVSQEDFPTWPPSPGWAFTFMPLVQLSYMYLFDDLFGPLDMRLNRALRRQRPAEEPAALEEQAQQVAPAPEPAAGAQVAGRQRAPAGILASLANFTRTVLDLFEGPVEGEVNIEVEVGENFELRIDGGGDEEHDELDEHHLEGGDVLEGGDEFQILHENGAHQRVPEQPRPAEAVENQHQAAVRPADAPPAPEPARQNQPPAPNNNNQNQNQRRNNNAVANPRDPSPFTVITNSIVSSLLLPVISYSIGALIRLAVPKAWSTPPLRKPPTGLLQQRWSRSLVGGCLYVVLRDVLELYTKYRRVQVKLRRKVKNVEKKAGRGTAAGGSA